MSSTQGWLASQARDLGRAKGSLAAGVLTVGRHRSVWAQLCAYPPATWSQTLLILLHDPLQPLLLLPPRPFLTPGSSIKESFQGPLGTVIPIMFPRNRPHGSPQAAPGKGLPGVTPKWGRCWPFMSSPLSWGCGRATKRGTCCPKAPGASDENENNTKSGAISGDLLPLLG